MVSLSLSKHTKQQPSGQLGRFRNRLLTALAFCGLTAMGTHAMAAPKVVTTIAPIHSITQAILGKTSQATLLLPPGNSPHSADFRPSQAKDLQQADLVIWVGPNIETFLIDPLKTLAAKTPTLELMDAPGILHLPLRTGADWEKHSHNDHDEHKDHDDHKDHKDHDKHAEHDDHKDHDKHESHDDHKDHDEHDGKKGKTSRQDNHIWLDPQNGIAMAEAITKALSGVDPENAAKFEANKQKLVKELAQIIQEGSTTLAPVKQRPFLVFHDAYQYLENRFQLSAIGSIMLQPGVTPGAARVKQMREKLTRLNAACLFTEPQFSDKIVPVLVENTQAKLGKLDPIGANQEIGATLYTNLIRSNIKALKDCLSNK